MPFAGLIWRVDLDADGGRPQAREWLVHVSMGYYPGALKPEQPGVNGVRFAAKTNALYYTATAKKLLMRVKRGRKRRPGSAKLTMPAEALVTELDRIIDNDRFPFSLRIRTPKETRGKFKPYPLREPVPPPKHYEPRAISLEGVEEVANGNA